ncbi:MAG: insecticidal delta-endotoxin Cry8Ea1 family protein [Clostridiales bacterium]|nr:insecticidal delta-endotoxin Cry8Ea1 family protein [Clostridiales bacterium]
MNDGDKKQKIINALMNVEYQPVRADEAISLQEYTKIPFGNLSALGIAAEPIVAALQSVGGNDQSGLYWVTVPGNGHLAHFRNENALLGAVLTPENKVGGGMARLNPVVCDPTMLFMAAAIMSINIKLDNLQQTQQEMFDYLKQKDKAELRGQLKTLTDVMDDYKHNWNNDSFKSSRHPQIERIKENAESNIVFYRGQIKNSIEKTGLFQLGKDVAKKTEKILSSFKEYQLSVYLYAFASFLDIMLLENFDSAFLDKIAQRIDDYAYEYRELYSTCYSQLKKEKDSSLQAHLLDVAWLESAMQRVQWLRKRRLVINRRLMKHCLPLETK